MSKVVYPHSYNGNNQCEGKDLPYTKEGTKQSVKDVKVVNTPQPPRVPTPKYNTPKSFGKMVK